VRPLLPGSAPNRWRAKGGGETALVRSILQALPALGIWCWRVNSGVTVLGGGKSRRVIRGAPPGTPDILGVLPTGRMFGLEVKTERGKLQPSQIEWHAQAERFGVRVSVVRSVEQAMAIVTRWRLEERAT
jgi:hypothetical protein